MFTVQEKKNTERIDRQRRAAKLLYEFTQRGFISFNALKGICVFYDSSITAEEIKLFWQISYKVTHQLCDKMETIVETLKEAK